MVDIGAQSTDLVVYYGDALQLASTARSAAITSRAISRRAPHQLRGRRTGQNGVRLRGARELCRRTVLIELPTPEDRAAREVPRRLVNQILEARAEELFRYVCGEFTRVGMERALVGGVVLTGGGAKLPGICDAAEEILHCQARIGLADGNPGVAARIGRSGVGPPRARHVLGKVEAAREFRKEHSTGIGKMLK